MPGMTRSAYLRVYIPGELASTMGLGRVRPHPSGSAPYLRAGRYGLLSEPLLDDALVVEWQGRRFVCPRHPRLRMLEGVMAFHNAYSAIGGELVVPESTARRAATELRRLLEATPHARSHILTSPWHVPLRWFVLFDPSERAVVGDPAHGIVYRTSRSDASGRIETALEVLAGADMEQTVVDEVAQLGEWLGEFPAEALVELDYGEVAGLFSEQDLALDDSAAEVWSSVEALARGDWEKAGEEYAAVAGRWARAVAVTYAN